MSPITMVLAVLVAAEFVFIMYLETFATSSEMTSATFWMGKDELRRPSVRVLFQNQGVYNGLLAILVLVASCGFRDVTWTAILMGYIMLVAAYGSYSSNPTIFLKQGGLATLTLLSCVLLR